MSLALARAAEGPGFSPRLIAEQLLTTVEDVARSTGLGRDALSRKDRIGTPKTQTRLREMMEILTRVAPRFGSDLIAYAWYRSEPLSGYGGLTAMHLVQQGRAAEVVDYIDAIDAGLYA
ncbi:MbcA/ParS/Xre antitoxin family protein [Rhodobacter sp. Har01]|uniref:antitoxin Xre/MbcA/ParS toxin-binding domain-containing protein n=1 Tax=Rhodobacter sp. Har01 TaxID=2883999 RepID=UPI001D06B4E7|nr:antitoxin Xre/MbcA/ParS toxin-binding domain-containing protein [Rhodobacter sp. Har01]MCB6177325.1 MbcA/ParS/Xre antitoxin family protein [Rhodobacter sp. Har01]